MSSERPGAPRSGLLYRGTWLALQAVDKLVLRTRSTGLEAGDPEGNLLLLSNHVTVLDPFCVGLQMWRPCRFMAATSVCNLPVLGPYLQALGAFPKMKFVKDPESMKTLASHYDAGFVVNLYPEGVRTWDGQNMEVQPGIGRLIKRLGARVMFARLTSAYHIQPRWARYPRWVPLEIEYVGPIEYPPEMSAEEITADVARRLHVTPSRDTSRWAAGFRLAEGLPELLWACPECLEVDALRVVGLRRREVRCSCCRTQWRLDIDHVLHREGETLPIAQAYRRIREHFGDAPVLSQREGVVAEAGFARLRDVKGKRVFAEGPLELRLEGFQVGELTLSRDQVLSVSVDIGSQVMVRIASDRPRGTNLRLEIEGQSALKWGTVLKGWLRD